MYTGIVQQHLPVATLESKTGLTRFSIDFPPDFSEGLNTGASVAVNGVCFTVTAIEDCRVSFDAIRETLELSNIKTLKPGSMVNVERSAKQGAEVGGHILSGHIIGTAEVINVERTTNNTRLTFTADPCWSKYVFNKGFLAINGASLTIAAIDREKATFSVNLIPETLQRTNFSALSCGDHVNIEIESQTQVIVDTVERFLSEGAR